MVNGHFCATVRRKIFLWGVWREDTSTYIEITNNSEVTGGKNSVHWCQLKQSHYSRGQAQRIPGSSDSQISWQRHRTVVGCQPYAPAAFTPRKYSWYSFLLVAEATPGPQCDRKDLMSMKNPLITTGIETTTFRFVAQHLNHCATAVPTDVSTLPTNSWSYYVQIN